jgi:hypothetical protein
MAELKPIQLTAALLLATGATITAAAEKAATTRQTIHQWLNNDYEFMAYINLLKKENTEAARAAIQSAAVLAVETISSIMQNSANDTVRLSAAKEVLAMAGLTKDTLSMANKGVGATTAHEIKAAIDKDRKFKAKMAAYD